MRFLMIDRVRELVPDQRIVAIKNVAMESDYLEHHFPGFPIFPGVLALEAMAQASGHLLSRSIEILEQRNSFAMMTANSAKYMKFVRPGDQLVIEATLVMREQYHAKTRATASVNGELCSRAEITFALKEDNGEPEVEGMLRHSAMLRRALEGEYR